jgi:lactate dehydrogenase-like 2-hydroxyacid dehydrogenase
VAYQAGPALITQEPVKYVSRPHLFAGSDVVTPHCPLTPETHHLIDAKALGEMKSGVSVERVAQR